MFKPKLVQFTLILEKSHIFENFRKLSESSETTKAKCRLLTMHNIIERLFFALFKLISFNQSIVTLMTFLILSIFSQNIFQCIKLHFHIVNFDKKTICVLKRKSLQQKTVTVTKIKMTFSFDN